MENYICSICGYIYDPKKGDVDNGVAAGTAWEDVPKDWICPICGAGKGEFTAEGKHKQNAKPNKPKTANAGYSAHDKELTALEASALCTNLARGCEKQYKFEEEKIFLELAEHFKSAAMPAKDASFDKLQELIDNDLSQGFLSAFDAAADDRGAKRALVWSEKVTKIQKSILARYQKEGDKMLKSTGIYVCTICGFIFIGDNLPNVCPVCKVPNWKFEKVEGGEQNV